MVNEILKPGAIAIRDSVKVALYSLHYLADYSGQRNKLPNPTIEIECIEAVEEALECCLSFEAIACLANNDDQLLEYGFHIGEVVDNTNLARQHGCSTSSIALGRHPDDHAFYCVGRNGKRSRTIGITDLDCFDGSSAYFDLPEWLNEHVERRQEFAEEDFPELSGWTPNTQQLADFAIVLV